MTKEELKSLTAKMVSHQSIGTYTIGNMYVSIKQGKQMTYMYQYLELAVDRKLSVLMVSETLKFYQATLEISLLLDNFG